MTIDRVKSAGDRHYLYLAYVRYYGRWAIQDQILRYVGAIRTYIKMPVRLPNVRAEFSSNDCEVIGSNAALATSKGDRKLNQENTFKRTGGKPLRPPLVLLIKTSCENDQRTVR
jgi:hypothetical protein